MKWFLLFSLIAFANDDVDKEVKDLQQHGEAVMKQLEGFKLNPEKFTIARQKVMSLATDDRFLKAATDLWGHPNRNTSLIVQAVFFLFMMVVKAWKQSRSSNWFTKMLTGLVLSIFTWVVLIYVIPAIVIGEPFRIVVSSLWKTLFS